MGGDEPDVLQVVSAEATVSEEPAGRLFFFKLTFVLWGNLRLLGPAEAAGLVRVHLRVGLVVGHLARSRSLRLVHGLRL